MRRAAGAAAVLVLAGLSFFGASCSRPPDGSKVASSPTENSSEDTGKEAKWEIADVPHPSDVVTAPWLGDLTGMIERRVIRVLTVHSAGQFYLQGGQERGITKEFARRFEKFINKQYGNKKTRVYIALIPVARDELILGLNSGRGDLVMASLSITPEREQLVDFSAPVTRPLNEILVTGPSAPALASIDDLAGETVYVRKSSSYRESLQELNEKLQAAGRKPVELEYVDESLEDDDLIEMVNSGLLPWAVVDDYKLQMWEGVFTELRAREDIVLRSGGRIAWAFRKNSPELAKAVNTFLKSNRQGTLVGNVLIKRYVTEFDWAQNALSSEDYARFEGLLDVFRKYGQMYEIDHMLLAAQGYQESRLQQSARSAAGAVGIMQILPTTAADPNIGITGIEKPDANIHAGTKYLAFLRNRYFSDPDIDPVNQTLMSLAAYNAGPRRMINLRNKAAKLGYNPNIWFDNVELVAASDVGQEPVQYVARIFKYYLAYRYAMRTLERREAAREEAGIE
jgi:membrane-bound lytic murein transglycosylase MltF